MPDSKIIHHISSSNTDHLNYMKMIKEELDTFQQQKISVQFTKIEK